jgi:hypothetical protein
MSRKTAPRREAMRKMREDGGLVKDIAKAFGVCSRTVISHTSGVVPKVHAQNPRYWITPERKAEIRRMRASGMRLREIGAKYGKDAKAIWFHCYDVIPAIVRVENGKALGGRNRVGL